jgi:AcrR family transcriptional regulator
MTPEATLSDRILDAAEQVLRRHGAEKTNVVDIAGVLQMSPGNVYRFFSSKKDLLRAVAVRWIDALSAPLETIAADRTRPASDRLTAWFDTLRKAKRKKLVDDAALFRVYIDSVDHAREAVDAHVKTLLDQIQRMISDGKKAGEFPATVEPKSAARAFLHATSAFHHPALVVKQPVPTEAEARALIRLVIAGLRQPL